MNIFTRTSRLQLKGFTLVETFVAISVLLIALVGPLSLAQESLKSAYYARDEITAFYLAQEGLELVRVVRDNNYLAHRDWLTSLDQCEANSCGEDFPVGDIQPCGVPGHPQCSPLYIDANGLYEFDYPTSKVSPFTRTLVVKPVGSGQEISATVTVSWTSVGITRHFILSQYLTDWGS